MGQTIDYAALAAKFGGTSQAAGSAAPMGGRSVLAQGRTSMGDLSEAPDESLIGRLMSALEPMAHPQSLDDIGHLLMAPVDVMRSPSLTSEIVKRLPSRRSVGSAIERTGQTLQHPVQSPGKMVEGVCRMVNGETTPPPAPTRTPRPGSFEDYLQAPPERQAELVKARQTYLSRGPRSAPPETPAVAPALATPAKTAAAPGLKLTPEEQTAFDHMVQQGHDPQAILAGIQEYRQSAPAPPTTTATQAPNPAGSLPRGIQTAAELKEFDRLLAAGKSRSEALQLIQQLRALQQSHGLPTSEQASQAVLDRNTRGRWPE